MSNEVEYQHQMTDALAEYYAAQAALAVLHRQTDDDYDHPRLRAASRRAEQAEDVLGGWLETLDEDFRAHKWTGHLHLLVESHLEQMSYARTQLHLGFLTEEECVELETELARMQADGTLNT